MYQSWPAFGPSSEQRRHRGASVQLACQGKAHFGVWMWYIFAGGVHLCGDEPWPSQEGWASQIDTVNPCSVSRLHSPLQWPWKILTVSSSHVSQFFKAMMLGCKSPEESLVDPKTGKMSMASINDIDFLQACNDGWTWTVIPFYVEEPCFDI